MRGKKYYTAPDHDKLMALIKQQTRNKTALVLLLAYHAAMRRPNMQSLRWENISEDFRMINMDNGRHIPVTPELCAALKTEAVAGREPQKPVLSHGSGSVYHQVIFSNWAQEAFRSAGMQDITLGDLHDACVLRWMQQYPWKYVSCMAGIHKVNLHSTYKPLLPPGAKIPPLKPLSTEAALRYIDEILEKHSNDYIGFLIQTVVMHDVDLEVVCDLTWDCFNIQKYTVTIAGETIVLPKQLVYFLWMHQLNQYDLTPYICAEEKTGTRITPEELTERTTSAFLKEGYWGATLKELRRAYAPIFYKKKILEIAEAEDKLVEQYLPQRLGKGLSYIGRLLRDMEKEGLLNKIGLYYYDAKKTVPEAKFMDVVESLCQEKGSFMSGDFAKAIGIDPRNAATQLRRLLREGKIEKTSGHHYTIIK